VTDVVATSRFVSALDAEQAEYAGEAQAGEYEYQAGVARGRSEYYKGQIIPSLLGASLAGVSKVVPQLGGLKELGGTLKKSSSGARYGDSKLISVGDYDVALPKLGRG
jgi:hypothetical protein